MSPLQIRSGFLYCNQYSYSWISSPSSLVAIFNICHCTRLHLLRTLFIVVQMCVAMRSVLYAARALYKSVFYSCKHEQGCCVCWVLLMVDVCFKFLQWLKPTQQIILGVCSAVSQLCINNCSDGLHSLCSAENDLHLLMMRPMVLYIGML